MRATVVAPIARDPRYINLTPRRRAHAVPRVVVWRSSGRIATDLQTPASFCAGCIIEVVATVYGVTIGQHTFSYNRARTRTPLHTRHRALTRAPFQRWHKFTSNERQSHSVHECATGCASPYDVRSRVRALRTRAHWRYGTDAVQVACWRPTAGPKRDVPTLDVCSLKIAVRVTLSRFTASLWIAVQERPL